MKKKIVNIIGMTLGSVLVACIILEIILEKMYGVSDPAVKRAIPIRENQPYTVVTASKDEYYNGIYAVEGVFSGLGDYHASIDKDGFIEPSKIHDEPEKVLLFLGGSTTECITVDENKRYPYLVGRMLEESSGYKINSYNAGVGGGNSHNSIDTLLHKGLEVEPDVTVLHHNVNDLIQLLQWGGYSYTEWGEPLDFYYMQTAGNVPIGGSVFARLQGTMKQWFPGIISRINSLKQTETGYTRVSDYNEEDILLKFENNLEMFIAVCEVNGITPVLMTQASRMNEQPDDLIAQLYEACGGYWVGIDYNEFYAMWLDMNQVIRDVAEENDIVCIDLANEIGSTEGNFYDMVHYTDEGSEKAADVIYKELYNIIKE